MSKKGLIGILIALFLIIVVVFSIFSWGKSSNGGEVKHKPIEKTKKIKKPVPKLTEKEKAEKEEEYKMYINQYQTKAFEIEIKHQDIFRDFLTALANTQNGKGTINDLYVATESAKEASDTIKEQYMLKKNIPEGTPKELKTRLETVEDEIYTGYYYKSKGFDKVMEFLNTHNASSMKQAQDFFAKNKAKMDSGALELQKIKQDYGLVSNK